ncbi:MAG: PAS domain S-box protein [Candidatus Omnitrophota bacterium]|nr:PAS domain S-box protein [Candidatus Omnitrophota bacterium]MDZ4241732.1 PAS domain S-box protein [Candidatus Omnitrophota bacterium]
MAADSQKKGRMSNLLSARLFRAVLNSLPYPFVILDAERRCLFINKEGAKRTGLPLSHLLGRRDEDIFQTEVTKEYLPTLLKAYTTRKPQRCECHVQLKSEKYSFLSDYVPLLDRQGRVEMVFGITRDVTHSRIMKETLQRSEDRFARVFQSGPVAIGFSRLRDGVILNVNDRCAKLFGYSREEMIGSTVKDLYLWADMEDRARTIRQLKEHGSVPPVEKLMRCKSGEHRTVIISMEIIHFEDPAEPIQLVMFIDISERKRMEESLRLSEEKLWQQKEALEQKNVALNQLLQQIEFEKSKLKEDIAINVRELVLPNLKKIRMRAENSKYIELVEDQLTSLVSSFGRVLTQAGYKLSPREVEICNMIKGGMKSKEIARLLNISCQTVEKHRKNIREKMELAHKGINLATFLKDF